MTDEMESAKVRNERVEKAEFFRVIQKADEMDRELLFQFGWYIENPATYLASEKQGTFAKGSADDYMYLWRNGVHLHDLERIVELAKSDTASRYDFAGEYRDPATLAIFLTALRWWEERVGKVLETAHQKVLSKLDLSIDTSETASDIGQDDNDIATYEALWVKYERLRFAREKAETVLNRKLEQAT